MYAVFSLGLIGDVKETKNKVRDLVDSARETKDIVRYLEDGFREITDNLKGSCNFLISLRV